MLSMASSSYQHKFEGRAAEKKWGSKSKERERNRKRDIGQKIKKRGEQEQRDEGRELVKQTSLYDRRGRERERDKRKMREIERRGRN